jgi:RHS repeat-associated protein
LVILESIYQYDSMGRRTKTYTLDPDIPTYPVATSETVYGRGWEELQRLDGTNTSNPTTTDILSLDGGLVPRKLASYSSGSASATRASYYQLDALGSGRAVTGAGGAVQGDFASFGDFGKALTTTDQPLAPSYTGYEHDAYTGLEYAKNRYYDPATASFISSDPYPVDPSDLLGMNLYNYVQGNPVNATDPLGWFVITGFSNNAQSWKILTTQSGFSMKGIHFTDSLTNIAGFFATKADLIMQHPSNWVHLSKLGIKSYNETLKQGLPIWVSYCKTAFCQQNVEGQIAIQRSTVIWNYDKGGVVPISELPKPSISTPTNPPTSTPAPTNPPTSTPAPTNPPTSTPTPTNPPTANSSSLILPIDDPVYKNGFGEIAPYGEYVKHDGYDMHSASGNLQVKAMDAGKVTWTDLPKCTEPDSGGWHTLWIESSVVKIIQYTHLKCFDKNQGEEIKQGEIIGEYGAWGATDRNYPHLHITFLSGYTTASCIDPGPYWPGGEPTFSSPLRDISEGTVCGG